MNNLRKNFVTRRESFVCEQCGFENQPLASGTRNHCTRCLYSKHVDESVPGDRASLCGGLMRPSEIVQEGSEWRIVHVCERCGKVIKNKMVEDDDFEVAVEVMRKKGYEN